jgi:glyoxylase-like metal-dependent hydrolase (beta-lactamase superfamily II)
VSDSNHWSWTLLRAGAFRLDGGSMFGIVPKALWSRKVEADANNRIPLQTNCLLLERDGVRVLIETGYGDKWTEKERSIYAMEPRCILNALAEHGVEPGSIDHVALTHLHFDHAGGLTRLCEDGKVVPNFPHAQVHVQRQEWDDALSNRSTMRGTYLRTHLDPIADCVICHDGEDELLPGLRVMPMPGHTWGQQAICFDDAEGTVCFPGDVLPTRNHVGLAFSMGYDMLPHTNMESKRSLFSQTLANDWRLVLGHETTTPVIRRDDLTLSTQEMKRVLQPLD